MDGGVTAIEVTMTVPRAVDLIAELARTVPAGVTVGAGTVLDAGDGARRHRGRRAFVVSPMFRPELIEHRPYARRAGDARLLHADRDLTRVVGRRRRREGVPVDGAWADILQGRARTAAAGAIDADRRRHRGERRRLDPCRGGGGWRRQRAGRSGVSHERRFDRIRDRAPPVRRSGRVGARPRRRGARA